MNWQPIETAPKDDFVFIWLPETAPGNGGYVMAQLHSKKDVWIPYKEYGRESEYIDRSRPTHWHPFPEPPKQD